MKKAEATKKVHNLTVEKEYIIHLIKNERDGFLIKFNSKNYSL